MTVGRFFAMIGALVRRTSDGKYLLLRRSAAKDYGAGEWECVTGRVDQGEGFDDALRREVREELGIEVEPEFIVGTTHFYRGEELPEKEMLGVIYCCSITPGQRLTPSWEHAEARWIGAAEIDAVLPAGHWLRNVVDRAEALRLLTPQSLLEYYRAHGFEA